MKFIVFILTTLSLVSVAHSHREISKSKNFLIKKDQIKSYGKANHPYSVKFSSSQNSDSNLVISARISQIKKMGQSQIEWTLPENWKVIEGNVKQSHDFSANQIHNATLVIDGSTVNLEDQAFLFVYRPMNGERYGVSTDYIHKGFDDEVKSSSVKSKKLFKKPKKFFQ